MKVIWIIDGSYLFKATTVNFDYLKLKELLEEKSGSTFKDSFYLDTNMNNGHSDAQASFYNWLKKAPPYGPKMRVKLYDYKLTTYECPKCAIKIDKTIQKGVDVGIATLIIKLAVQNQYDRLILSTGDGDFEDSIAYVKEELQKEIWIAGFVDSISADLQSYADKVIWLNDYSTEIQK